MVVMFLLGAEQMSEEMADFELKGLRRPIWISWTDSVGSRQSDECFLAKVLA